MFLDRFFLALLIIFLPTQLGKHFFPNFSLIYGLQVDYLAPTLYLTDVFLILLVVSWFIRKKEKLLKLINKIPNQRYFFPVLTLIVFNLLLAQNKILVLLKLIKVVELLTLSFYILSEKTHFKKIINYLVIGASYSCFLAIFQFLKQSSLGGIFWFLGERTFNLQTPGVAKAIIFGKLYLRPYASFPHPNVLAGFLSLLLPLILITSTKNKKIKNKILKQLVLIVILITLFLTFSRITIIIGLLGFILTLSVLKKEKKIFVINQLLILITLMLFLSPMTFGRYQSLLRGTEETIKQRNELIRAAVSMIYHYPLFGVGLNNFFISLPFYSEFAKTYGFFQPVHNTYLLVTAEMGIFGLYLFISLLLNVYKKTRGVLKIIFSQMLLLLFFDHYFYTLQQGQLLFTLLISLMIKKQTYAQINSNT